MKSDEDFKHAYLLELEALVGTYIKIRAKIGTALEKEGVNMDSKEIAEVPESLNPVMDSLISTVKQIDDKTKEGRKECESRNIEIHPLIPFMENEMQKIKDAVILNPLYSSGGAFKAH